MLHTPDPFGQHTRTPIGRVKSNEQEEKEKEKEKDEDMRTREALRVVCGWFNHTYRDC
jgi:hypothetical protein